MCGACAEEYRDVERPTNTKQIIDAIARVYAHPDGGVGGPLHIVLDDYNVNSLDWCEDRLDQIGTPNEAAWLRGIDPVLVDLCRDVIALMKPLTEDERGAVLADYWGD